MSRRPPEPRRADARHLRGSRRTGRGRRHSGLGRGAAGLAAAAVLHDRRRPFLELVDPQRQVAQDVLIDAHRPFEFGDRRCRAVDVEQHEVALAVLLHAVGEVAQAPIFTLLDLATLLGDQLGEGIGQRIDLGAGDVLARDKHVFVKRHRFSSLAAVDDPVRERLAGRAGPDTESAAGKGKARTITNAAAGATSAAPRIRLAGP